mmetsp:Transcript_18828/g.44123  ORF Transcript_18828/g.44123 Transcript_18828/m.44123 type:complete len:240 (+) Transcript_18828:2687-3406(+)
MSSLPRFSSLTCSSTSRTWDSASFSSLSLISKSTTNSFSSSFSRSGASLFPSSIVRNLVLSSFNSPLRRSTAPTPGVKMALATALDSWPDTRRSKMTSEGGGSSSPVKSRTSATEDSSTWTKLGASTLSGPSGCRPWASTTPSCPIDTRVPPSSVNIAPEAPPRQRSWACTVTRTARLLAGYTETAPERSQEASSAPSSLRARPEPTHTLSSLEVTSAMSSLRNKMSSIWYQRIFLQPT